MKHLRRKEGLGGAWRGTVGRNSVSELRRNEAGRTGSNDSGRALGIAVQYAQVRYWHPTTLNRASILRRVWLLNARLSGIFTCRRCALVSHRDRQRIPDKPAIGTGFFSASYVRAFRERG